MDRAAVFVDAGYLFAASSRLLTGELLPRSRLTLDYDAVLDLFARLVTETAGMPLLRIYWYDGTATGPTPQQITLAYRPSVKVRLGFVNQNGEQKGVDSLIVTDLISLSRNRAMADALLLTGDEDIRVGVQQAQEFGVRVHLLGIAPARENQSRFLVQEADSVRELGATEVESFLSIAPPVSDAPSPVEPRAAAAPGALDVIARRIAEELRPEEREAMLTASAGGSVPAHIDRQLLLAGSQSLGCQLTGPQKREIRTAFLAACRANARTR